MINQQIPKGESVNIFVYGTLKPGHVFYKYVEPHLLLPPTPAITYGHLYDLKQYPAVVLDKIPLSKIYGYLLIGTSSLLTICDIIEGVNRQHSVYQRRYIDVWSKFGKMNNVFIYHLPYQYIEEAGLKDSKVISGWWGHISFPSETFKEHGLLKEIE